MTPRLIRFWLPPALWAALILLASTDLFAARESGRLLQTILATIVGRPLPEELFAVFHVTLRKLAHLVEYAILGLLLFRALRSVAAGWRLSWSAGAVAIALAVAVTDETLQSLSRFRSGSPADVMIDLAGAVVAQLFLRLRNAAAAPVLSSKR